MKLRLIRLGYEATEALGMTFECIEQCEQECLLARSAQAFLEVGFFEV